MLFEVFMLIWSLAFGFSTQKPIDLVVNRPSPTPTPKMRLYVPKLSQAALTAKSGENKAENLIAGRPTGIWVSSEADFERLKIELSEAEAKKEVPVVVAYNIPFRNCDLEGSEGAKNNEAYFKWAESLDTEIAGRAAILIVEPDALANLDCLAEKRQKERLEAISYVVKRIGGKTGVATYIDIGHDNWLTPETAAERLKMAGVERVRGFALNVSNFGTLEKNIKYGKRVSGLVGGKYFVIDTARNGTGPHLNNEWCNPDGVGLGKPPTFETGEELVDAFLWVKPPGESDGYCNGGPKAGEWWPEYAAMLIAGSPYF